ELLDERNVREDRDQQLAVDFLHVDEAEGIAARIDAERLVEERTALRGQRIVEELVVHLAIAGADGRTEGAGRQIEQATLKVGFDDRLAELRAVLQVRADRLLAVLAEAGRRRAEEVQAAGAGSGRGAETARFLVALIREALAEVRRAHDRTGPHQRVDARLPREGVR